MVDDSIDMEDDSIDMGYLVTLLPASRGLRGEQAEYLVQPHLRAWAYSFTFRLNVSTSCGIRWGISVQ